MFKFLHSFKAAGGNPVAQSVNTITQSVNIIEEAKEITYGPVCPTDADRIILASDHCIPTDVTVSRRNANVFVLGGAKTEASKCLAIPNIMACNHNYIVNDPDGMLYAECKQKLADNGYIIKLIDFTKKPDPDAAHYDPIKYISNAVEALSFSRALFEEPGRNSKSDPFWTICSSNLLASVIVCVKNMKPDATFDDVIPLLHKVVIDDDLPDAESEFDIIVSQLVNSDCTDKEFLYELYSSFKRCGKKTKKAIVVDVISQVAGYMGYTSPDNLEFDKILTSKYALFVKTTEYDANDMNILVPLYSQFTTEIAKLQRSDRKYPHIQFIMPDFLSIGKFPALEQRLVVARRYNYSFTLFIKSLGNFADLYSENYHTVYSNCDTRIYLGAGTSLDVAKIEQLMCAYKQDKVPSVAQLKNEECMVKIRGYEPQVCKKFFKVNATPLLQ